MKLTPEIRFKIRQALHEDLGTGDVTTRSLILAHQTSEAVLIVKSHGIFCGGPVAEESFRTLDRKLQVVLHVREGKRVRPGKKVLTVRGRTRSILRAERTAVNFLSRLSGVATLTDTFVQKVKGTRAKIYDTRKTTPLWRMLEKQAVKTGGGENHRFGLWDEILVKENHWAALGGILRKRNGRYFSDRMRAALKRKKIPVEVEVRNLRELAHVMEGPYVPDRILLDNFSVPELKRAVLFAEGLDEVLRRRYKIRRKKPALEASGGVTLANVRPIALTGVTRISVGALTHSAPALDFSLLLR